LAQNKFTNEKVAVKQILKRKMPIEEKIQLSLEIELLRLLSEETSTNIIKIFDVFEDTQKIMVVMEYIEAGHMYSWIKEN
jgi:serine/threonine protein kinase